MQEQCRGRHSSAVPLTLEACAEKIVLSPDRPALANGSEAVKGQFEIERHILQVLGANAGPEICDVANRAKLYTTFLVEK
jgi:hypothetical protein